MVNLTVLSVLQCWIFRFQDAKMEKSTLSRKRRSNKQTWWMILEVLIYLWPCELCKSVNIKQKSMKKVDFLCCCSLFVSVLIIPQLHLCLSIRPHCLAPVNLHTTDSVFLDWIEQICIHVYNSEGSSIFAELLFFQLVFLCFGFSYIATSWLCLGTQIECGSRHVCMQTDKQQRKCM